MEARLSNSWARATLVRPAAGYMCAQVRIVHCLRHRISDPRHLHQIPGEQTPTLLPLGLARTGGDRELKAVELHVRVVLGVVVAAGDRRAALTDRRF